MNWASLKVSFIGARWRALSSQERNFALGAGLIILVSVLVRLAALRRSWFWYDEYYSAVFSTTRDVRAMFRGIAEIDFHPPLYYLQLKAWAQVSSSQSWLLANSLFWSLVAFGGVFLSGSKVAGKWGGFCSLAVLGCLPFAVKEATELRMYSMLIALSAWGVWAVLTQLTSEAPWRSALFSTLIALAIAWSHGAGVLWLAFFFSTAFGLVLMRVDSHAGLRSFLLAAGVSTLGVMPCLVEGTKRHPQHLASSGEADWAGIFAELVPGVASQPIFLALGLLGFVLLVVLFDTRSRGLLSAITFGAVCALVTLWALGFFRPVVHLRSVTFLAPVFSVCLGSSIGRALSSSRAALIWFGAAVLALILVQSSLDLAPLLLKPERSSANYALARRLDKFIRKDQSVWAPRVGTAYSLCWELGGPGSIQDPTSERVCDLGSGRSVYSGSRRPRGMDAPYLLVLRNKERVPRLPPREKVAKWRKVPGHRLTPVNVQ